MSTSKGRLICLGGIIGYLFATLTSGNNRLLVQRQLGEEEGLGEGNGEDEPEYNELTMNIAITCCVLLLIFLTVCFEEGKEYIEEHVADRSSKPIIASLFGEMTVLGFVSAFAFCLSELEIWESLSEKMFHNNEELLEMFELIHYMLFLIMIFFVVNVLLLVKGAEDTETILWVMNNACIGETEYMKKLYEAKPLSMPSSWISYLCRSLFRCRGDFYEELLLFDRLRQEFILERSDTPPFYPTETEKQVSLDFQFGRYLSICLGHSLGHIVHLSYWTWGFLGLSTVLTMGLVTVIDSMEVFAWVWAGAGWTMLLASNYFNFHILRLLHNMIPPNSSLSNDHHESDYLLSSEELLPAWTNISLPEGDHKHKTRQDTLYWMGRKAPRAYAIVLQIQLLFTSSYIALLALYFFPKFFSESHPYNTATKVLFVIVSVLPTALQASKYRSSTYHLTVACSIGVHRKPHAIAQVIRMNKTDQLIRSMVTMQKLQNLARIGFTVRQSVNERAMAKAAKAIEAACITNGRPSMPRSLSSQQLSEVSQLFDVIDSDGDGHMDPSEITGLFQSLGQPMTPESIDAIIDVLDDNGDGLIQKEEFVRFYSTHCLVDKFTSKKDVKRHLKLLAHDLFARFDLDMSGEVTLSEFKAVMDAFDVGFTVDEIGQVVMELDQHHSNGNIDEHEFYCLLETHRHLFTNTPLPPL